MKILITGAKGQLGKTFAVFFDKEKIQYVPSETSTFDITDLKAMREFLKDKGFTHIINCAAYNAVDKAQDDWHRAYTVNGLGVRNLAICANEFNCTPIHYSTNYVFSGKKEHYTIADRTDPINKYGESKVLGERYLSMAHKSYLIRVGWLFGGENQNFVRKVIDWSKKRKVLSIADDEIASPTYTLDLVQATMELIQMKAYGLYHITNTPTSRYDWAKLILKQIGWKGNLLRGKMADFALPAKRPAVTILDNFGLYQTSGRVMRSWEEATVEFLQRFNFENKANQ